MLELTEAEARTVWAILSVTDGREARRIRASALSPSTYYSAKKRAYEAGWLVDRIVPNPLAFAGGRLRLRLARQESWSGPLEVGGAGPEGSQRFFSWSGLNARLEVEAIGGTAKATSPRGSPAGPLELDVSPSRGEVPVFFDFAGLWSRFLGAPCPRGYPRGLEPARRRPVAAPPPSLDLGGRGSVLGGSFGRGEAWISVRSLEPGLRRDLRRGRVRLLQTLQPSALPPVRGRSLGLWVFLSGRLRPGVATPALVAELNRSCGVFPFLAADDGQSFLLGASGVTAAATGDRLAVATHPVREVLGRFALEFQSIAEPAQSLRSL